jgi:hypothetical protein
MLIFIIIILIVTIILVTTTTTTDDNNTFIDTDLYYYAHGDSCSGIALKNPPENAPVVTNNSPTPTTSGTQPVTNNKIADEAVTEINNFRAKFGLPALIYDVSKNAAADACAAYDAKNGYHASMSKGMTSGASGQCECSGVTGANCVKLYENEQSIVQNPTSANPICGSVKCGHWCIILGSFTSVASGTSGNFCVQNFYGGKARCSF